MRHILIVCLLYFIGEPQKVLFVGDSLTAYEFGWQYQLSAEMNYKLTNISKAGMKTDWMLETLTQSLKKNHDYDQIFIYGGINDIFTGDSALVTAQRIQKIVNLCNSYNIKPILVMGYDARKVIHNTWIKDKALEEKRRNEYILYQEMLTMIHDCKILPIVKLTHADTEDGIHLTANGHKKFAKEISRELNEI